MKQSIERFKANLRRSAGNTGKLPASPAHTVWPQRAHTPEDKRLTCIKTQRRGLVDALKYRNIKYDQHGQKVI